MDSLRTLIRALVVATAIGVVAAACSSGNDTTAGATDVTLIEPGVLTVCTFGVEPFEIRDDQGNWSGFDIELLEAMATGINGGVEVAVTVEPLDGIWLAPADGTCDVVATALTITDERAAQALFTDPYFVSAQSLMVLADRAGEVTGLDSLDGQAIGVLADSTGQAYATANAPAGAEVVGFPDETSLFAALDDGTVAAVLHDLPLNISRFNAQPGRYALVAEIDTGERYGFVVAKDNTELAGVLNAQLARVRSDGTYQRIYDRYFTPVTTSVP